jgi:hypothetical protein
MTEMDDRLGALFALDEPRVSSPRFVAEVMEEVARRRFHRDLQALCLVTLVAVTFMAVAWPLVRPGLEVLAHALNPVLMSGSIVLGLLVLTSRRGLSLLGLET